MNQLHNLRVACRKLKKRPLFSVTAIACLALGIGASTAIFSVVNSLLLRSTIVEEIDDVVFVMALREGMEPFGVSPIEIEAYRTRTRSFRVLGIAQPGGNVNLTRGDRTERVRSAWISPSYLTALGITPFIGRNFTEEEDREGGPFAVLLSHALWMQLGASTDLVSSSLRLDARSYTVVGVLPPGFDLPAKNDVWFPMRFDLERFPVEEKGSHAYILAGRLEPGVTIAQADADLKRVAEQLAIETPRTNSAWSAAAAPIRDLLLGDVRGRTTAMIYILAGAVAFLLAIACVNAANLFLARFVEQERELAVSAALGAGRARLIAQLLTESGLLAIVAGSIGIVVAIVTVPFLMNRSWVHEEAYTNAFRSMAIDFNVLVFGLGLTVVTALVFGAAPAWRVFSFDLGRRLKTGPREGGSRGRIRWSFVLVAVEIAVSITLLAGAGLLVQSFRRLSSLELGFRPNGLVSMGLTLPESAFPEHADRIAFSRRLLERVRTLPSVADAGLSSDVPLDPGTWDMGYIVEGVPAPDSSEQPFTAHRVVSPGYLDALGVALTAGRSITAADRAETMPVVVISEELARRAWAGEDPLGKRLRTENDFVWRTVIGVVENVKEDSYNFRIDRPVWYLPQEQVEGLEPGTLNLVFRARGDIATTAAAVRNVFRELYPELAPGALRPLDDRVSGVTAAERTGTMVATILAVVGTALSSIGLYGVMAYSVRQRFRELGIRMAFGADPRDLRALVLGHGLRVAIVGLIGGLFGAVLFGRWLSGLLFEISPYDPVTLLFVCGVLVIVTIAACFLPARRASRTDPVAALRAE